MQQSRYKIKFINGDLEGRSFAVKDSGLVIGSSMNADIRSSEYGVAEEHITLLPQFDAGILLHNPGNGSVWVRNVPVSEGDDVQINPGDDVRIGKALSFVLENYSEQQPQGDMPDIDNSGEATVVAPSGNTKIPGEKNIPPESSFTRYASAEELAELRDANKSIARQRKLAMFIAVVVSAIIVALAYYISESRVENPVTWPGTASGNYDDGEFKIDLGNNGKFLIYYPNSPSMVAKPGDKSFEVLTAVGKNLDVPFHITFTSEQVEDGFKKTARESFEEWMEKAEKDGAIKFVSQPENDFFNRQDNGYPYIKIEYSRKFGGMSWRGVACYMRFLDKEILLMREVPASQYWRCADLVMEYDCISIANSTVARHWEVPEAPLDEDSTKMLQTLNHELRKNIEIASWSDIDLLIKSLFAKAYARNEKPVIDATESMLEKFRSGQKIWYSRKCLEYSNAQREGNNAEMARILNECLEKFEPLDDYRYTRIMKNDWSVE